MCAYAYILYHVGLHPGRTYKEPRFYYCKKSKTMINFLFVTRVWTPEIDRWLCKQEDAQEQKLGTIHILRKQNSGPFLPF